MNKIKLFVIFAAAAFFIAACGQAATNINVNVAKTTANAATPAPANTATPVDEVAMAKNLYTTNCMACHRDSGKGGKMTHEGKQINPEDLTADKFKKAADDKLIGYVTNGIEDEGMPAFKDKLTADQIKAVIKHVRTLQK